MSGHPRDGMSRGVHRLVLAIYTAVVTIASLRPGDDINLDHWDKVVHLLMYYIFAVLGYRAMENKRNYVYLCLGIIAYGGLLELGQSWIPGRSMSMYDLMANTLGVALGAAVVTRPPSARGKLR